MTMTPNETYYYGVASGEWLGDFDFRIADWPAFLRTRPSPRDLFMATVLDGICRAIPKKTIRSRIRGYPASQRAESGARVVARWLLPIGAVTIYELRGRYDLGPNGSSVTVDMTEQYGPLPVPAICTQRTAARAEITSGGYEATYALSMFGSSFRGHYVVRPDGNRVEVRYTPKSGDWAELRYSVDRIGPKQEPGWVRTPPTAGQLAVRDRARLLEALGEKYDRAGDLRAVFAHVYAMQTFAIAEGLPSFDPGVSDGIEATWVRDMTVAFSQRFLDACEAWDAAPRRHVSPAWRMVFEALSRRTVTELDAMALCIYAHIVYDLPHALVAVGAPPERIEAFHLLNQLLDDEIDRLQDDLASRYGVAFHYLDAMAGRIDELFTAEQIVRARTAAWYTAERLARGAPLAAVDRELTESVGRFVSDLLDPRPEPLRVLAWLGRKVFSRTHAYWDDKLLPRRTV